MAKKNWIAGATAKNKGSLRKTLKAKPGQPIPLATLKAAAAKSGVTGKRARLAITLRKMNKK